MCRQPLCLPLIVILLGSPFFTSLYFPLYMLHLFRGYTEAAARDGEKTKSGHTVHALSSKKEGNSCKKDRKRKEAIRFKTLFRCGKGMQIVQEYYL
jgi:hypothetical protein